MRPRKHNRHLPPCVYLRHGSYWHVKAGKWTNLGRSLPSALAAYGRMLEEPTGEMPSLIDEAIGPICAKVAASTRKQYEKTAKRLKVIFAEFSPSQVTPRHIAQMRLAHAHHPNMANRMLTVLRMIFDYALDMEMVDINPCVGNRRLPERKRKRYVTDAEYQAVYAKAGPRLQCIMALLYLTAQRPVDVLKIRRADISDDGILFQQQKTGARLLVAMNPALRLVIDRAKEMSGNVPALTLLYGRGRRPVDYRSVAYQWRVACSKADVADFQLRDLRAKSLTDAKNQGLDPQVLAGHASAAMTDRYIRLRQLPVATGPTFGQSPIERTIAQQDQ